jgi:hypothetical protein
MSFGEKSRVRIPLTYGPVRSPGWNGDELVNFVGGGAQFRLDGSTTRAAINWAYRFDTALLTLTTS